MPYFAKKRLSDEEYLERKLSLIEPSKEEGFEWIEINDPNDVEIYVEPTYNPSMLIDWAIEEYPSLIESSHEAALIAFANNPERYVNLFIKRADKIDKKNSNSSITEIANAIISKAKELGAKINL